MKNYNYRVILYIALLFVGCTVEVPETDNGPPRFLFKITGDNFEASFDENTDFNSFQLNLRTDAVYSFQLSASDDGGTERIEWQYAPDYVELITPVTVPWTENRFSTLSSLIRWQGNLANPLSGSILVGDFRTNGNNIAHEFRFLVRDYGGRTGSQNTFRTSLRLYNSDGPTAIVTY